MLIKRLTVSSWLLNQQLESSHKHPWQVELSDFKSQSVFVLAITTLQPLLIPSNRSSLVDVDRFVGFYGWSVGVKMLIVLGGILFDIWRFCLIEILKSGSEVLRFCEIDHAVAIES